MNPGEAYIEDNKLTSSMMMRSSGGSSQAQSEMPPIVAMLKNFWVE